MATISKAITENTVRTATFEALNIADNPNFKRISNQAYGIVFTDDNGVERMVELRAVVRSLKTMEEAEMTASELLDFEASEYQRELDEKAEKKAEKDKAKAEKIAKDKAKREAAKAKKEAEAE